MPDAGVPASERTGGGPMAHLRDAAVLLVVIAAPAAFYVLDLGRHSDDWWFYRHMLSSRDRSWSGLYETLASVPWLAVRPGQVAWYATFQTWLPSDITAVHIANHVAFALGALLLHAALRAMPALRGAAYPVTLLYVSMPHFSAAKFWYANHMATLSFSLFAAAALASASLAREPRRRVAAALVGLVGLSTAVSNLCYELFGFMLPLLPLLAWLANGRSLREAAGDRRFRASTLAAGLAFAATTLFKMGYQHGVSSPSGLSDLFHFAARSAWLYLRVAYTTFWTLGLYSPRAAGGIAMGPYFEPAAVHAALLALALMVARLVAAGRMQPDATAGREARWPFLVVTGIVAFGLGYLPFLVNFWADAYPWGEVNRVNIGGALGAAMVICGALRWLEGRSRPAAQAVLLLFCATGIFLQVATGRMWVRAAERQDAVVAAVLAAAGDLRAGDTVLIYGLCPYLGPAAVLRSPDDTGPRLMIASGGRILAADLIQPDTRLTSSEINTNHHDRLKGHYPYRSLVVVDLPRRAATRIESYSEASAFFAAHPIRDAAGCSYVRGRGTPLY